MSAVPARNIESSSSLFNLEIQAINGHKASTQELVDAIENDVKNRLPISKTAIFKHYTGNCLLNKEDLKKIVFILQNGVVSSLDTDTDAALSYTQAAIICTNEISKM